uniref:Uncharacterized protein n=1 Tax=Solanum lycopersicum TaxID=4081 RepID=A0A3Q7IAB4_SOLLC
MAFIQYIFSNIIASSKVERALLIILHNCHYKSFNIIYYVLHT